ncbi:TonB-dependent receptor plug domain-containing protein [Massilia sp. CCM 8695]|uniref:TonB-dependent receptor plug domain-containing protein n=1 Tax=Massilia frigida TaxID=2609281 RepID=A0ABX0NHA6_9BURK|nr:TonB-dependent receptor plug domain-containing protein [Massilia frigida]
MLFPTTRTLMSLAVASAFGCALLPGQAQTAGSAADNTAPANNDPDQIQEVKVTATRHSTSLLRTPLAVTALSQDPLTRKGAQSLRDLAGDIPNVVIENTGLDSAVQITIRGITSTNFTETGDPAVGFHVDGLYSPRPQGAQAPMFDIGQRKCCAARKARCSAAIRPAATSTSSRPSLTSAATTARPTSSLATTTGSRPASSRMSPSTTCWPCAPHTC